MRIRIRPNICQEAPRSVAVLLLYQCASITYFGLPLLKDFSHKYVGNAADPTVYIWYLVWWPYALLNHINPFITKLVWAPAGINVLWSTSMPAASLVAYPVTRAFGPVVAYNVLCLVAPALSGWAAFLLFRYVSETFWPAVAGGYLFGFSTYFVSQIAHLPVALVFPVPLGAYLVVRRLDNRLSRASFIAGLSATIALQYTLFNEIVASAAVFGFVAFVVAFILCDAVVRRRLTAILPDLVLSICVAAVFLSPLLYCTFAWGFPRGTLQDVKGYSSDLVNFLVPTPITLLGRSKWLSVISARFLGDYSGDSAYISVPLWIMFILFAVHSRKTRERQLLVGLFIIVCIASLGPKLLLAGKAHGPMPWALLMHLPLLDKPLPGRFMMYAFLLLGLIAALWLKEGRAWRWLVFLSGMVLLMPNWAYHRWWTTQEDLPAFFSQGMYRHYLAPHDVVLILPFSYMGSGMLWQAETGMYFTMAGGYLGPAPAETLKWPALYQLLIAGRDSQEGRAQLADFLAAHDVKAIIVATLFWPRVPNWPEFTARLIKQRPIRLGGVVLFPLSNRVRGFDSAEK
jgi:hypothetical protein